MRKNGTFCYYVINNDKESCQNLLTRNLVMSIMQLKDDKETCQKYKESCQDVNNRG